MLDVLTGEGSRYGPFASAQLLEFVAKLPPWICWQAVAAGVAG